MLILLLYETIISQQFSSSQEWWVLWSQRHQVADLECAGVYNQMCCCFHFTTASVHIILTCAVLCCHSNTWCLAAFLSHAQVGRGMKKRETRSCGGEEIQVVSPVASGFCFDSQKCFQTEACVCVCATLCCLSVFLPLCPSLSLSLSLSIPPSLLPLADHMPQSVSGALPPPAVAMLVQRQIAQYAAVWARMHAHMQAG